MTEKQSGGTSSSPDYNEKAYERIVQRVKESLASAEEITLEGIKYDIDQAIEFEEDAQELTREELSLLGAYLKRDLENLNQFIGKTGKGIAQWLKFDAGLVENKLLNLLLSVADKTTLEQHLLEQELAEHQDMYTAGEYVMVGTFQCDNCEAEQEFIKPGVLDDCSECGGDKFLRVSED